MILWERLKVTQAHSSRPYHFRIAFWRFLWTDADRRPLHPCSIPCSIPRRALAWMSCSFSSHVNFCLVQEATQWQGSHRYPSVRLLPRMVHFPGSELMARWFHGVMSATGETVVQLNLTFESGTSYRLKLKRALVVERVDQFEICVMYVLQQLNQILVFVLICEWVLGYQELSNKEMWLIFVLPTSLFLHCLPMEAPLGLQLSVLGLKQFVEEAPGTASVGNFNL